MTKMPISDFERLLWVLAEEMEGSISSLFRKVADKYEWVNDDNEAHMLMRRMRGIFVASLVGEIEENIGRSFASTFDQLSDQPTSKNSKYWFVDMPKSSTVRGRAKVMWAIRQAYTHGNGHVGQIDDDGVAAWVKSDFAPKHFRGVSVENDIVQVFGDVTHPAIKTALEINDQFNPNV